MKTKKWCGMLFGAFFLGSVMFFLPSLGAQQDASKEQKRAEVRKMAGETLARLYKIQPGARKAVEGAAGYAVFSNFGMKIFLAGGGSGEGIAVNIKTKKETFMKMVEVQAGLGLGIKKFRLVWVFAKQSLLNDFGRVGLGLERPDHGRRKAERRRGGRCRSHVRFPRHLALPADGRRAGAGAHRQGDQVLQGRCTELEAFSKLSFGPISALDAPFESSKYRCIPAAQNSRPP